MSFNVGTLEERRFASRGVAFQSCMPPQAHAPFSTCLEVSASDINLGSLGPFLFFFVLITSTPFGLLTFFLKFYSSQLSPCLILSETQYPGTIQRIEKKFFSSKGSGSEQQVEFSWRAFYMFFTETTK